MGADSPVNGPPRFPAGHLGRRHLGSVATGIATGCAAMFVVTTALRSALGKQTEGLAALETASILLVFGCIGFLVNCCPPLAPRGEIEGLMNAPPLRIAGRLALGPLTAALGIALLQAGIIHEVDAATPASLAVWATSLGSLPAGFLRSYRRPGPPGRPCRRVERPWERGEPLVEDGLRGPAVTGASSLPTAGMPVHAPMADAMRKKTTSDSRSCRTVAIGPLP